jgi:hypothetical protein
MAKQQPVEIQMRERKRGWIGHTLWKPHNDLTREALDWNPQGVRRRGCARLTWRRLTDEDLIKMGRSWKTVKELLRARVRWLNFTEALCSIWELQDSSSIHCFCNACIYSLWS